MSKGCPIVVWKVSGLFLVSGRCLEGVWKLSGRYQEGLRTMSGSCLEGVWNKNPYLISTGSKDPMCLEVVWKVFGLEGVCSMFGRCLEFA